MRKFTKGCLLTALVIFVLGCLLCTVGGILGGFRQLEDVGVDYSENTWEYMEGDWDSVRSEGKAEKTQIDLSGASLRNMEVNMGVCGLYVLESDDEHVWIAVDGDEHSVYYTIEDGDTLRVENSYNRNYWPLNFWPFNRHRNTANHMAVYLFLPKDLVLDELHMDFGAGKIETAALRAKNIELECGAGEFYVDEMEADTVYLSVGVGQAVIDGLTAKEAELEAGAGELIVGNIGISDNLDLSIGMGNAEINGSITGDADVEADMGSLTMNLTGSQDDYTYSVDCSMGNVTVGGRKYTGFSDYVEWGSGSRVFDIDCSMGDVTIRFDE